MSGASAGTGLLLVYTGDGKGKTTAALGLVFRALGRGLPVAVVQFIKGGWETGEQRFAAAYATAFLTESAAPSPTLAGSHPGNPDLTFLTMGQGFTWEGETLEVHARAARAAWERARELVGGGAHRVVVLDELTHAIHHGFVPLAEVLAALKARPAGVTVVVTGRGAPPELVEAADLVTEMRALKHPFERGVPALAGVDF